MSEDSWDAQETYSSFLALILMNKLPTELRLIVSCKTAESALDFELLMKTLEEETVARDRTMVSVSQLPPQRSQNPSSAATLMSGASPAVTFQCELQDSYAGERSKADTPELWSVLHVSSQGPRRSQLPIQHEVLQV